MCFASNVFVVHHRLLTPVSTNGGSGVSASSHSVTRQLKVKLASNSKQQSSKKGKIARSKARVQTEVCADCGASDPSWASINRGILLCSDCCSVHRSLGRHVSIVKSLRQGTWEPSVLNFVNSLNAHGANSVWEHNLPENGYVALGASGKGTSGGGVAGSGVGGVGVGVSGSRIRKPTPKDPLHPNKSDFIKAKHLHLAFVRRPDLTDGEGEAGDAQRSNPVQELSRQLHASVRTSNLETSLRLLVQGADPNYFHEEKASTPLHVAAKFGQMYQVELLLVYGADINAIDGNQLTPIELAKANNHNLIAERLQDAMYEVTDRLSMFLGGKKPDHASGHHLVIPDASGGEISDQLKIARGRLQLVPNKMFEELVMDLYDEVDRRENEAIWSTSSVSAESAAVPFLPANPYLSATRNQGRQKLARFNRNEFNGLLTDVLIDARRRQNMANLRPLDASASTTTTTGSNCNSMAPNFYIGSNHHQSSSMAGGGAIEAGQFNANLSDDEPIYDPVADDDYEPMPVVGLSQTNPVKQSAAQTEVAGLEMESLRKQIDEYVHEINQLKNVVQKLSHENTELKTKFSATDSVPPPPAIPSSTAAAAVTSSAPANLPNSLSVYDEPLRIDFSGSEEQHNGSETKKSDAVATRENGEQSSSLISPHLTGFSASQPLKRPVSMYERCISTSVAGGVAQGAQGSALEGRNTSSMYQCLANEMTLASSTQQNINSPGRSLTEEVNRRADTVTHRLKDLIHAMQASPVDGGRLVPCAEAIQGAVLDLIEVFTLPSNSNDVLIRDTLLQLNRNNMQIQHNCENLRKAHETEDQTAVAKYTKDVRETAYYIASATKTLVLQLD